MFLDQDDLLILKEFCRLKANEETTTWKIMRKLYPRGRDNEHMRIKKKIEKMAKYNFFFVEGKPKAYTLNSNKVYMKKINYPNRKKSNSIMMNIEEKWQVFEI